MDDKTMLKLAFLMHEKLSALRRNLAVEILENLSGLTNHFKELSVDAKRISLAVNRNWFFAAQQCQARLGRTLEELSYDITRIKQLTDENDREPPVIDASLIFEELKQIQREFTGLNFNKEQKTISVITKPITLEDIYLGPFQIELHIGRLSKLYKESPYFCIALEPNPAGNNDDVTHPHVSGGILCEGEGSVTIRAALEQGRLCDFFTLINSILNTYSPDSPYVSLEDWEGGESCYDCGTGINNDDAYYCTFCDRVYCSECSSYCRSCDDTCCLGCGGSCPNCEEFVCHNCLKKCPECGETFCKMCMEDDVCENCKEQQEELENQNNETDGKQDDLKIAG
ncbi:MAG: hypothetical protein ABR969_00785 [Sedimentisphaerales bacterium]|jgi:hypothetical protein